VSTSNAASIHSTVSPYSRFAVALHWLLAAALFAELALGWWMLDVPKNPPGVRAGWFNLHKSIGLTIAVIVLLRALWRTNHHLAAHPALPRWQRRASTLTHVALYLCMLVIPLSGYLGSSFTRYPVRYFGFVLPDWNRDWPAAKELMSDIHSAAVWLFVALLALHIAAALWHWLRGDAICTRMGLPPAPRLSRS
jgi:cytochrome b561